MRLIPRTGSIPVPGTEQNAVHRPFQYAEVAQLVERNLPKVKVAGSRPVFRSSKTFPLQVYLFPGQITGLCCLSRFRKFPNALYTQKAGPKACFSRFRADSNRCTRFCRPLPSLSATKPFLNWKCKGTGFRLVIQNFSRIKSTWISPTSCQPPAIRNRAHPEICLPPRLIAIKNLCGSI